MRKSERLLGAGTIAREYGVAVMILAALAILGLAARSRQPAAVPAAG